MSIFKRLFGICVTGVPSDQECWKLEQGKVEIDLSKAQELTREGGALRLEGRGLDPRMLIIHGIDGRYHAYQNNCACSGWRLDPVEGEEKVKCCTLASSTYDYDGKRISGPAEKDLATFEVELNEEKKQLLIALN